jgi:polyisoprenyl-teichoic acid--peptidoglycan teichoic acid transferase
MLNKIFENWLFYIGVFVVGLTLSVSAYFAYKYLVSPNGNRIVLNFAPQPTANITSYGQPTTKEDFNILLLGYGGKDHSGGTLTDSITLVNVNPQKKLVKVISVPRDLYVNIPVDWNNSQGYKINAAYSIGVSDTQYPNKKPEYKGTHGGGNLAKAVVGEVTGLKVDYYVSVDFSKYSEIIDLIGGINVSVPITFTDNFYPVKGLENETCGFTADQITDFHTRYSGFDLEKQFTCRYEKLHFDKGITKMDGATALKFVRSRHSDESGNDFSRSERQHAVLAAIKDKVISLGILSSGNAIYQILAQSVTSDLKTGSIEEILKPLGNILEYKIVNIYLTDQNVFNNTKSPNGAYILVPKEGLNNYSGVKNYLDSTNN